MQDDADFTHSAQDSLQRKSRRRSIFTVRRKRGRDLDDGWMDGQGFDAETSDTPTSAPEQRQPLVVPPVKLLVTQTKRLVQARNRQRSTASLSPTSAGGSSDQIAAGQVELSNDPSSLDEDSLLGSRPSASAANVLAKDAGEREQARQALTALVEEDSEQTYEGKSQVSPVSW